MITSCTRVGDRYAWMLTQAGFHLVAWLSLSPSPKSSAVAWLPPGSGQIAVGVDGDPTWAAGSLMLSRREWDTAAMPSRKQNYSLLLRISILPSPAHQAVDVAGLENPAAVDRVATQRYPAWSVTTAWCRIKPGAALFPHNRFQRLASPGVRAPGDAHVPLWASFTSTSDHYCRPPRRCTYS